MASKYVLKLSDINEFFGNDNKVIKKGENALESNHVKTMSFDADLMVIIRGKIHASMRDKTYDVEITLSKTGDILSATCVCPRGIKCHHIAALALFGHYNISVTDKECTWNAPKVQSEALKTAEELYPSKAYVAVEETITENQKEILKNKLSSLGTTVGFLWLLQEESAEVDIASLPLIENIISSVEFSEASDKIAFFQVKCAIDDKTVEKIATMTVGQVLNEKWFLARKFRLTASNFGLILAACRRNRYPPSLFKTLLGEYNLDGIKSIQWGRSHEKDGIEFLRNSAHLDIHESGIWLTNSGLLGASPDGLVGEDTIVEVKCPYSYRNDIISQKLVNSDKYIIYFDESGQTFINQNHNYYHQIQGNLHILKRKKCYLCIWTLKEIVVVLVEVDEDWAENLQKLENFYVEHYLPKLLEK